MKRTGWRKRTPHTLARCAGPSTASRSVPRPISAGPYAIELVASTAAADDAAPIRLKRPVFTPTSSIAASSTRSAPPHAASSVGATLTRAAAAASSAGVSSSASTASRSSASRMFLARPRVKSAAVPHPHDRRHAARRRAAERQLRRDRRSHPPGADRRR